MTHMIHNAGKHQSHMMRHLFTGALLILVSESGFGADYDPLFTAQAKPEQIDLDVKDEKRSREIPIRVYLPTEKSAAAVVMSPGGPARGDMKQAFGSVQIPWMLLTGTKDSNPISGADATSRLVVFPLLPSGSKYQLILDKAEHSAFTERALPGETERRNPNHHRAILAVTTAFWDAHLRADPEARRWLDSGAVKSVLDKDDVWQTK